MKTCLICGAVSAADAPSCDHCGEASWCPVEPSGEPVAASSDGAAPLAPDAAPEGEEAPADTAPEGATPDTPKVPRRRLRLPPS